MAQHKITVIRFLNELNSQEVKGAFDFLSNILKELEDKIDPDPIDMLYAIRQTDYKWKS